MDGFSLFKYGEVIEVGICSEEGMAAFVTFPLREAVVFDTCV